MSKFVLGKDIPDLWPDIEGVFRGWWIASAAKPVAELKKTGVKANKSRIIYGGWLLMKKLVMLTVALSLLIGAQAYATDDYPPVVKKKLYADTDLRGKPAPKLEVKHWLTGAEPVIGKKVVLIDFWATWCPPCRELIKELNGYQKKFGEDLVVIGISDESAETIKKFMKSNKIEYNVAVDPDQKMKSQIGVQGIPHVLVITPDHIVRWQGYPQSDEDPLTEEKIARIIKASKDK